MLQSALNGPCNDLKYAKTVPKKRGPRIHFRSERSVSNPGNPMPRPSLLMIWQFTDRGNGRQIEKCSDSRARGLLWPQSNFSFRRNMMCYEKAHQPNY